MEVLLQINSVVNSIVWGPWMCAFLLGTGVYLTIILGVPQVRYFVMSFTNVFGKGARKGYGEEGTISPFAALATALAGIVNFYRGRFTQYKFLIWPGRRFCHGIS
jgi:AGCS family alanine or glycine:cation symporter